MIKITHFLLTLTFYALISQTQASNLLNNNILKANTLMVDTLIPDYGISGHVATENNQTVSGVIINSYIDYVLTIPSNTDNQGNFFYFSYPFNDKKFTLKAQKRTTEDKYSGITIFDISKINRYLLDIDTFASPAQYLAADVNNDKEIDASDMLMIRNFLLRKRPELPNGTWRFIDKRYKFKNPRNPLAENIPDSIFYENKFPGGNNDFLAIKYGDVNSTYTNNLTKTQVRQDKALNLSIEDMELAAGKEYIIQIQTNDFNAQAFQGTFSLPNTTIKSVKGGNLIDFDEKSFGLFKSDITTSWYGTGSAQKTLFYITFVSERAQFLSDILSVNNNLTPTIAYDDKGDEMAIQINFKNKKNHTHNFELLQNSPNPFSISTTIDYNLPKEGDAQMTFFTIDGKVILSKKLDGTVGHHSMTIQKSELNNVTGIIYYRLETLDNAITKRMVITH